MITNLISFSVKNKLIIILATLSMVAFGVYSITQIPIGAVPDITNNQVQVITTSRNLSTLDVEQFITYPIELEMANLPGVQEIRSISKFGLSVVTIVFEDKMGTYLPRQLIAEKIKSAEQKIPVGIGTPEMGPISTGLGEIYQYTLEIKPGYEEKYSISDLRTIQDWTIKRHLAGLKGVVEVNTWGGFLKQYEVAVDPQKLIAFDITINDVYQALEANNENTGGSYIEKLSESYFVRGEGMVGSLNDIGNIVVKNIRGIPVLIRDIGKIQFGNAVRFGAITGNGEGEKVLGQIMMLKDANTSKVIKEVKERMAQVDQVLPEGVYVNPFLERTALIDKTTNTVVENLTLGALIVIFVLIVLMGDLRSGILVASVIPLSLLFGLSMMYLFGVDVNLMSLGAIDFGILVDGAVIIVEFTVFLIIQKQAKLRLLQGQQLQDAKDDVVIEASSRMMRSAIFGQIIILIVFIPILSLTGIEGKMFRPMALSFSFILIGAMILCLTYVPAMAAHFIRPPKSDKATLADKIVGFLQRSYDPVINYALDHRKTVIILSVIFLVITGIIFSRMGGEFIPTLDEGDYVVQPILKPGTSLSETVKINTQLEKILMGFPEVEQVITRIGAAEVPTDPMSMEMSDVIIILKDRKTWTSAKNKEELADKMKEALSVIPGIGFEFTQPIEMRFNELITGVRSDVAIKIYGEDLDILFQKGNEIRNMIYRVKGASDVNVEQIEGLPQVSVEYDRSMLAKYGLNIRELNDIVRMAFAGVSAGYVFEGEKRFDLVVRLDEKYRNDLASVSNLHVGLPNGNQVPLREIATINYKHGPAQISRDDTRRRIVVSVNVRNRDVESLVEEIQEIVDRQLMLPEGYYVTYGGQFENLENAKKRLIIAVPVALLLIFILLHFTFNSVKQALLVFSAIPLAAIGGVFFLWLRGMPFSISAGVGFIALFGIATLNGIILISFFNELKYDGKITNIRERILTGTRLRLRPVLLTAATDILGFFPMAFSTSAGAEVQRPLATVVIGGLFTATLLTMIFLPVLYHIFDDKEFSFGKKIRGKLAVIAIGFAFIMLPQISTAQEVKKISSLEDAVELALKNNAGIEAARLQLDQQKKLRGTAFDLGKTTFFYGEEERAFRESNSGVVSYGISQSIPFPTEFLIQSVLLKKSVLSAEYVYQLNKHQLEKEVSLIYNKLLYDHSRLQEFHFIDSLYAVFSNAATRKYELGESAYLEKLTAGTKLIEIKTQLKQIRMEYENDLLELKKYLQDEIEFIPGYLYKLVSDTYSDSSTHLGLLYHNNRLELHQQQNRLEKHRFLPDIHLEYMRQSLNNESGFYGFQFGISIPLWPFPQNARSQASGIQIQVAKKESQQYGYNLIKRQEQLISEVSHYQETIKYYEESGLMLADELVMASERNYREGETDYMHYIQGIEQATRVRLSYLDHLHMYNQSLLELKYLQ